MPTWVSPDPGLRDREKECGLPPKYSCIIPGDGLISFQCVATVNPLPELGPITFSVSASDTGDQPLYTTGERLVGLGNSVGKHVSCSLTGLVSGVVGELTYLQPDFPHGGLRIGGDAVPITFTFTILAIPSAGVPVPRTFQIIVYHSWSIDRDNFVVSTLGQAHLDELQAAGYCNN